MEPGPIEAPTWRMLWLGECQGTRPRHTHPPGFFQASSPREREHITQKPLEVMRQLVRIAPKGGTVLDPFAGSGTTGVAAVIEGRNFVGVELTEHYHQVAETRIRTAAQGYRDDGAQGVLGVEEGATA